jgi:hypothetical protein
MFLSEFDFKLVWGPGIKNMADAPSCQPDFIPKKGDEAFDAQLHTLLMPYHTTELFPDHSLHPTALSISAITTLTVESNTLLNHIKIAQSSDTEAQDTLKHKNSDFTSKDGVIYHKGHLYVPLLC